VTLDAATGRSLGYRVLAFSREETFLDAIPAALPATCDTIRVATMAASLVELRERHYDIFITDEPALILVLHDRFPSPAVRTSIAEWLFMNEYSYGEFLREYHERFRELSAIDRDSIPTLFVTRYADATRQQLDGLARQLSVPVIDGIGGRWADELWEAFNRITGPTP
jgi:hypothetical protein